MEPAAWQTLLGRYRDYLDEHPPIMIPGKKTGPGTGSHYLSIADRLLVCVLKTRWSLPQPPPASLLGVSEAMIGAPPSATSAATSRLSGTPYPLVPSP